MDHTVHARNEAVAISEDERGILKGAEKILQGRGLEAKDLPFVLSILNPTQDSDTVGNLSLMSNTSLLTPPGNSPGLSVPGWFSFEDPSDVQEMEDCQFQDHLPFAESGFFESLSDQAPNEHHAVSGEAHCTPNTMAANPYLTPGESATPLQPHTTEDLLTSDRTLPHYPSRDLLSADSVSPPGIPGRQQQFIHTVPQVSLEQNYEYQELQKGVELNPDSHFSGTKVPMDVAVCPQEPSSVHRTILPKSIPREKPTIQSLKVSKSSTLAMKRRGRFKDVRQKQETAQTREDNACPRCWRQKIRCNPVDPNNPDAGCRNCQRVRPNMPCVRWKLPQAELLDKADKPRNSWTLRFKSNRKVEEMDGWRNPNETKTIRITQDIEGSYYSVTVGEFVAVDGDQLFRSWKINGKNRRYFCPPFAITDMHATVSVIADYVDINMRQYILHYTRPSADHFPGVSNKLLEMTYSTAYIYCNSNESPLSPGEKRLLKDALRLWVACRMENRRERIVDLENLGITPQSYDNRIYNIISPVMAAQIEIITMVAILVPKQKAVLKGLNTLIRNNKSGSLFTIYLTMFILLHSCGLLVHADMERSLREPLPDSKSPYFNKQIVSQLHKGANNILYYFHYFNQGRNTFESDWSTSPPKDFSNLNSYQTQFMRETVNEVRRLKPYFERIKASNEYHNQYFFLAQLYESNWQTKGPNI